MDHYMKDNVGDKYICDFWRHVHCRVFHGKENRDNGKNERYVSNTPMSPIKDPPRKITYSIKMKVEHKQIGTHD